MAINCRIGLIALSLSAFVASQYAQAPSLTVVSGQSTLRLSLADLTALPRETVEIAGENGNVSRFEGATLGSILLKAGLALDKQHLRGRELATYIVAHGRDGYDVTFSAGELAPDLGAEHVIVADSKDGQPLGPDQGPFRLVVAREKRPARSVRLLERLEISKPH